MASKITVMVVDDHRILREGISALLNATNKIEVIAHADNGREAVRLAKSKSPDIVLIDPSLPLLNGIEASRQIKREAPCCRIIALSNLEDEEVIRKMLAAGAMGYLTKDTDQEELIEAIYTVHKGEMVLSTAITRLVVEDYLRWADIETRSLGNLTPRESEVLQLIAEGHDTKAIASFMSISVKTVRCHRSNLMQKLNLHNQAELIQYAIQKKIIEI